ncbi:MAG: 30S ribosomal protein S3, partial [Bacteroidales bacterium]|nr:30S ribosomal protein S3 [Bacteroidales bacterium]
SLSKIVIERTLKLITVTIHTARPGIIIGKGGTEVDKLKEELKNICKKDVQINIFEVKRPEVDANIVANNIARQLEGRVSYRRAIKMAVASTMRMGAEGIKVQISGRVGGAEMARSEMFKEGRTPLHTIRADIDYALAEAHTKVGVLGVKVWICNGEVYGKRDLSPNAGVSAAAQGAAGERRGGDRRPRGDRRGGERRGDRGDRRGGERRGRREE